MKQSGNIILILVVIVTLTIGALIFYKSKPNTSSSTTNPYSSTNLQPESTKSAEQTKIFKSSNTMKFSINVPANYQIEEKFTTVSITTPNGILYVNRSGTNFDNLDDYLKDLEIKNHFSLGEREKFIKESLTIISGLKDKEKVYFIFADGWVYSLSTTSEALFDDLDQIAKSFQYIP